MTIQEYHDLLVKSATDGTFPSYRVRSDGDIDCLYRGEEGRRCAVGVLIPDELYDPSYESTGAWSLPDPLLETILPDGMTASDLELIQEAHDNCVSWWNGFGKSVLQSWDPDDFIARIDELDCFKEVARSA